MSEKPLAVFSGPDHSADLADAILSQHFNFLAVPPDPETLLPAFRNATVFVDASMKVPLSARDIQEANNLKLVITATTGATHIDHDALEHAAVPLLTLKGQTEFLRGITPAAELSWALVMACSRHLIRASKHVNQGSWERTEFPGLMLKGRSIGLIGMGRIGSWMANYANAFGMKVQYYDPFVKESPDYAVALPLDQLVAQSDIVSIHVHADENTTGMVNRELLSAFNPGSIFINTARSELTDEKAIVEALETGRLASVGVDVLIHEPDPARSPLWQYAQKHDNVVITPHIGGFCPDAVDHVVRFTCKRILDFFDLSPTLGK